MAAQGRSLSPVLIIEPNCFARRGMYTDDTNSLLALADRFAT